MEFCVEIQNARSEFFLFFPCPVSCFLSVPTVLIEKTAAAPCRLLIERLPEVWVGTAADAARPQDESLVTHAAKVGRRFSSAVVRGHSLHIPHAVILHM